jgi:signal peptidase II
MEADQPGADRARSWARVVTLIGSLVAVDQVSKQLVVSSIEKSEPLEIMFGLELVNVRNRGVAFGLLAGDKGFVLLLTLGALALLLAYFAINPGRPRLWIAVGLISGGALGNLADRVRTEAVIDFLDPPIWPAFNLADIAIVTGVALLILGLGTPRVQGRSSS